MKDVKKCEDDELVGRLTACACAVGTFVANAPCAAEGCDLHPILLRMYEVMDEMDRRSPGFKKTIERMEEECHLDVLEEDS